jgi:hypothetical protein
VHTVRCAVWGHCSPFHIKCTARPGVISTLLATMQQELVGYGFQWPCQGSSNMSMALVAVHSVHHA